jgi:SAM-dependent methyltransferase
MAKENEIHYVGNLARVLSVPDSEVEHFLNHKPFSDAHCWRYLMDMAQIMSALPPAPARILDLGCGSGWTSEMFARQGHTVLGLDIAPDMIALARRRLQPSLQLAFEVCDYEARIDSGLFDAVTIYDALHHAEDEARVIANAGLSLKDGGVFISIEPGAGHSETEATRDVVEKYGTTEKDMPYAQQLPLLHAAGFGIVRQYLRLNHLVLESLSAAEGGAQQEAQFATLLGATQHHGLASMVVAVKGAATPPPVAVPQQPQRQARSTLSSIARRLRGVRG